MNELSIFIDESGDFGKYHHHSPYYIVTMVFHKQDNYIGNAITYLEEDLSNIGFPNHCVHSGPIIRGEEEYRFIDLALRRKIFNKMISFIRKINFKYHSFHIDKKHINDASEISNKLIKNISSFILEHYDELLSYDLIKIYYDNGQNELSQILSFVFNAHLPNVAFKKVIPSDYRLFQVADLLCTTQLYLLKKNNKSLSKSEITFFGTNERDFKQNYMKPLTKKKL